MMLVFCGAGLASAQVPVPVDDRAATDSLRRLLGLEQGQLVRPVESLELPIIYHNAEFATADGIVIRGEYAHSPTDPEAPVVILLHNAGGTRARMKSVQEFLLGEGLSTLAIDLRGHGASTTTIEGRPYLAADFQNRAEGRFYRDMTKDIGAAIDWLERNHLVKNGGIYLLGRRVGAVVAAIALVEHGPRLRGAILDTPASLYRGIDTRKALSEIQGRPILVLAARSDTTITGFLRQFAGINPNIRPGIVDVPSSDELMNHPEGRDEIAEYFRLMRRQ